MSHPSKLRRWAAAGMAAAFSLLLAACLVTPGKFEAALDIRKDGRFTYTYKGEVFVLGLSELMKAAKEAEKQEFKPTPCYADEVMEKERACTKEEIAEQKKNWEEEEKARVEKEEKDLEMAKAMLGGLDPTDPQAAEELAARLRRQHGWNSVVYKGNGLYEVDFKVSGQLTHDFAFPTIEKMPQVVPFFVINRRASGEVRLDSPALGADQGSMGGLGTFGQMMAAEQAGKNKDGDAVPSIPQTSGRFVLTTDGTILANNTDEGPKPDPTGKRLEWTITPRESSGPMALIGLGK